MQRSLDEAERALRTRGLQRLANEPNGFLLERRAHVSPLTMRAGRCYTFVASSSTGIVDLDLLVFDAEGAEVARDTMSGGRTAARLCPPQTGAYHVAVRAARGNGVFAMRFFEGPPGTGGSTDDLWSAESQPSP